jgi:hypothetical protein
MANSTGHYYSNCIVANNIIVDLGQAGSGNGASGTVDWYDAYQPHYNCISANNISVNNYTGFGGTTGVLCVDNVGDIVLINGAGHFVLFTPYGGTNNDYHLVSSDTLFRGQGTNLSRYFSTDRDGNLRPASGAWDIGPYQYSGGGSPAMQLQFHYGNPLNASNSYSFGSVGTNIATTNTLFTVQNLGTGTLSGTGSVAAPFFIVSGSTYSLAQNQSQPVTVCFKPTAISNYSRTITLSGNGGVVSNLTLSGAGTASTIPASPQMVILAPGP